MALHYGVCYYPEHVPTQTRHDRIAEDIRLMRQAGLNVVRIAEFAWSLMEPAEGRYDFGWLDAIVRQLGEGGIRSVICTPTAAPPLWVSERYPEVLYQDGHDLRRKPGGRRYTCVSSEPYRRLSRAIAEQLARRYGGNPHVLGFQIDNELAQEYNGRCHCPVCLERFRAWLKTRYASIDELNRRWGTVFWGQQFGHYGQIRLPVRSIELQGDLDYSRVMHDLSADNPSLRLEYERFASEEQVGYCRLQLEAMRPFTAKPITTNGTGTSTNDIDTLDLFRNLDVVGLDHYPGARDTDCTPSSFRYALARTTPTRSGPGAFWLLETLCGGGHGNWAFQGMLHGFPGTFRQNSLHAFCSGAGLITLFKLHAFPFGFEQLGSSLIDLDRIPRRRFAEICDASRDLARIGPLLERTGIQARAALLFDIENLWSLKMKPVHRQFEYTAYCQQLYHGLRSLGFAVDVIGQKNLDQATGSDYRLLVLPAAVMVREAEQAALCRFVARGGVLLATFLTSIKDTDNNGLTVSAPGGLTGLFGLRLAEGEPVFAGRSEAKINLDNGSSRLAAVNCWWTESLELLGARAIGRYADTFRADEAVITEHRHGRGSACYLGCGLDETGLRWVLNHVLGLAGIAAAPVRFGDGIDVITRSNESETYHFIFNFNEEPAEVQLQKPMRDFLTGQLLSASLMLPAKGLAVVQE